MPSLVPNSPLTARSVLVAVIVDHPQSLISMSTPAGRSSRINESTVLGVGLIVVIRRLWVRISKCSRLSLYLCGERMTQKTFFSVGNGTGPATLAPVRVTVSTILRADESMTSWSEALSLNRIFCSANVRPSSRLWVFPLLVPAPTPGVGRVGQHSAHHAPS